MSFEIARGGHCTSGGSIKSGRARCQCGTWSAADYDTPGERAAGRRWHLEMVLATRKAQPPTDRTGENR